MAREASMLFGIFGKKKSTGKLWYERGGYPKPTRLPGSYKEWQPPVKEPAKHDAPAAKTGNLKG